MNKVSRVISFKLDLSLLIKRPLAEKECLASTLVTGILINALYNISKLFVGVLVSSKTAISFNSDLELVPTFILFELEGQFIASLMDCYNGSANKVCPSSTLQSS